MGDGTPSGAAMVATIDSVLAGGGLLKSDLGTLVLTNVETYTGATTISQGTLVLSGAGSLAASSGVANDGTFDTLRAPTPERRSRA